MSLLHFWRFAHTAQEFQSPQIPRLLLQRARRVFGLALNVLNRRRLAQTAWRAKPLPRMNADRRGSKNLTTGLPMLELFQRNRGRLRSTAFFSLRDAIRK
jgi:hypothetical protein